MSREEVQISDLEPSIIGEDVTRYAIQIRGVDGNGNEGSWSTILEYESPELLPSLESNNYIEGVSGWRLDNDGTFEVNDGFIRGTLQSANYVPNVSGWALDVDGNVEFSTGTFRGALRIGQNTFNVDPNGNLYIGGTTPQNAPFSVDTNGNILAMSIDAGFITAGQIGANVVYAGTIVASQITSGTINGNRIPNLDTSKITSGVFDPVFIPNLSANKITTGTLNANNVTISGTLSAVTLSGVGGTFSGNLNAVSTSAQSIIASGSVSSNAFRPRTGNEFLLSTLGLALNSSAVLRFGNPSLPSDNSTRIQRDGNNRLVLRGQSGVVVPNLSDIAFPANVFWSTASNRLFRATSRKDTKTDIDYSPSVEKLLELKPVTYYPKDLPEDMIFHLRFPQYGVLAEDADDLGLWQFVVYDQEGNVDGFSYDRVGVALIPYVKELYDRIEELERRLNGT